MAAPILAVLRHIAPSLPAKRPDVTSARIQVLKRCGASSEGSA